MSAHVENLFSRPDKVCHRRIVSRKRIEARCRGAHWVMTLECGHVVTLPGQRGKSKKTECEKCALGLTPGRALSANINNKKG